MSPKEKRKPVRRKKALPSYNALLKDVAGLLEDARRTTVRTVNAVMTTTYWLIGWRIVEAEQGGDERAQYGEELIKRLAKDLTARFGRGFGRANLFQMRAFYLAYAGIVQTTSGESANEKVQTLSGQSKRGEIVQTLSAESACFGKNLLAFPLSWSHYVRLLSVKSKKARRFYEEEALRGGWSVRQLDRQIGSQFYERTALSRNKKQMLTKGQKKQPADLMTPEQEIKDPYVLEFLDLKDEYSESELEEALILRLEDFLMELGGDFTFVGRQKRLRVGDAWYRIDLVFYHRRLRCLVLIDLKLDKFTHADAGQMHLYCNYAREHWTHREENPPVGLVLCADKNAAVARYALDGLPNKILAAEYKTVLPDEEQIAQEIDSVRASMGLLPSPKKKAVRKKRKAVTTKGKEAGRKGRSGKSKE